MHRETDKSSITSAMLKTLFTMARGNDFSLALEYYQRGINIATIIDDEYKESLLNIACSLKNEPMIYMLTECGGDVNHVYMRKLTTNTPSFERISSLFCDRANNIPLEFPSTPLLDYILDSEYIDIILTNFKTNRQYLSSLNTSLVPFQMIDPDKFKTTLHGTNQGKYPVNGGCNIDYNSSQFYQELSSPYSKSSSSYVHSEKSYCTGKSHKKPLKKPLIDDSPVEVESSHIKRKKTNNNDSSYTSDQFYLDFNDTIPDLPTLVPDTVFFLLSKGACVSMSEASGLNVQLTGSDSTETLSSLEISQMGNDIMKNILLKYCQSSDSDINIVKILVSTFF